MAQYYERGRAKRKTEIAAVLLVIVAAVVVIRRGWQTDAAPPPRGAEGSVRTEQ